MSCWTGYVHTTEDALILIEAARTGTIPRVKRRLTDAEKNSLDAGSVVIYDEQESHIKRWTDSRSWTPSRINSNFLVYRELANKILPSVGKIVLGQQSKPARKKKNKLPAKLSALDSGGIVDNDNDIDNNEDDDENDVDYIEPINSRGSKRITLFGSNNGGNGGNSSGGSGGSSGSGGSGDASAITALTSDQLAEIGTLPKAPSRLSLAQFAEHINQRVVVMRKHALRADGNAGASLFSDDDEEDDMDGIFDGDSDADDADYAAQARKSKKSAKRKRQSTTKPQAPNVSTRSRTSKASAASASKKCSSGVTASVAVDDGYNGNEPSEDSSSTTPSSSSTTVAAAVATSASSDGNKNRVKMAPLDERASAALNSKTVTRWARDGAPDVNIAHVYGSNKGIFYMLQGGLRKKTMTIKIGTSNVHLICYYRDGPTGSKKLTRRPSDDPTLKHIRPLFDIVDNQSYRFPPDIVYTTTDKKVLEIRDKVVPRGGPIYDPSIPNNTSDIDNNVDADADVDTQKDGDIDAGLEKGEESSSADLTPPPPPSLTSTLAYPLDQLSVDMESRTDANHDSFKSTETSQAGDGESSQVHCMDSSNLTGVSAMLTMADSAASSDSMISLPSFHRRTDSLYSNLHCPELDCGSAPSRSQPTISINSLDSGIRFTGERVKVNDDGNSGGDGVDSSGGVNGGAAKRFKLTPLTMDTDQPISSSINSFAVPPSAPPVSASHIFASLMPNFCGYSTAAHTDSHQLAATHPFPGPSFPLPAASGEMINLTGLQLVPARSVIPYQPGMPLMGSFDDSPSAFRNQASSSTYMVLQQPQYSPMTPLSLPSSSMMPSSNASLPGAIPQAAGFESLHMPSNAAISTMSELAGGIALPAPINAGADGSGFTSPLQIATMSSFPPGTHHTVAAVGGMSVQHYNVAQQPRSMELFTVTAAPIPLPTPQSHIITFTSAAGYPDSNKSEASSVVASTAAAHYTDQMQSPPQKSPTLGNTLQTNQSQI